MLLLDAVQGMLFTVAFGSRPAGFFVHRPPAWHQKRS
jgi:hypothetical protein